MNARLAIAVTAVLAVGCVHEIGQPLDVSRAAELQPGVSTLADAKARFGEPTSVSYASYIPGTCYVWLYARGDAFGNARSNMVSLCFGNDGKLVSGQPSVQQPVPVKVVQ